MISLKEGQKAPDFKLKDSNGKEVKLSEFKGKNVALYFYPKDDTSGCTKQACDFRDNIGKVKKLNAVVLGISNDDEKSHKKFTEKYGLNFTLLCDTDKKVSKAYGAYGKKKFMGKEYMGITRSTFVIDEKGNISKIFYKVNPEKSISEVLEALKK
ncbi:thioredoxin-dependent thiol peroxidase [Candidatus Woesearchaeota archaeon]|nr:thioredoxin-dependent thiol peroxidase [Candidatus Woesearchaeota archaeon]